MYMCCLYSNRPGLLPKCGADLNNREENERKIRCYEGSCIPVTANEEREIKRLRTSEEVSGTGDGMAEVGNSTKM